MRTDWLSTTLGEVASLRSGGTPSKGDARNWGGDLPWVTAKDMKTLRLQDTEDHLTEVGTTGTQVVSAQTPLILVRGMTLHSSVPISIPQRPVAFNQDVKAVVPRDGVESSFLAYWLLAHRPMLLAAVDSASHGTGRINSASLTSLPVQLPPVAEQRAIAGVLGALDDKIELNGRMNETLATLASAMYSRLRQSSSAVVHLGEVVELAYGKALKESDRRPGAVPVFGSNGIVGRHDRALAAGPGIVVGRKGNPGIVTWSHDAFYPIDTTFYVVPRLAGTSLYYLYFALRTLDLPSFAADSAVPGLNRNIAYGLEIDAPSLGAVQGFDRAVSTLFDKKAANDAESRTLAELRDALLPKLISGELRVRNVDASS